MEAAAYVLFGEAKINIDPWERTRRQRLTSFDVLPVPEEDLLSTSRSHVTWSTRSFVRLCQRAKEENLVPGIVHSHPNGYPTFSNQDNENERDLFHLRDIGVEGTLTPSLIELGNVMLRNIARRSLEALRVIPRSEFMAEVQAFHPTPEQLRPGKLFIVRDDTLDKWICFRCPCGCGAKVQQIGRLYYWFGNHGFDRHWFHERLTEAIGAAGPRYNPQHHVELDIAESLEDFARTIESFNRIKSLAIDVRQRALYLRHPRANDHQPLVGIAQIKLIPPTM